MRPRFSTDPHAVGLVALMAVGSVVMWVGVPVAWVLLAAQVSEVGHTSFGPLAMVLVGAPITMIPVARGLSWLDHRHQARMEREDDRRVAAPWRQSMRDGGTEAPPSVLGVVMVISVAIALAVFSLWFFVLAGSPPGSLSSG